MSSDRIFTRAEVENSLEKRSLNIHVNFTFSKGDVFTAFVNYHHDKNLYKLRPCVVVEDPDKKSIKIVVVSSTSSIEPDKEYYSLRNIEETNMYKNDSELLLEKYLIDRRFFWKKIGHLSDFDREELLGKIDRVPIFDLT